MSTPKNWNQPQDLGDWMRGQEKRGAHEERRPQVRHASDIMGPGLAPRAVEVRDWNSEETAFNGFFYSAPGSINSPDGNEWWVGQSIAEADGYGMHYVWNHHSAAPVVNYRRRFSPNGDGRIFGAWEIVTSGGGGGGSPTGAAGGSLTGTYPNPTIANGVITDVQVAAANKDGLVGVPSLRTIGTGAQQAAAGTHAHTITDLPVATSGTSSSTQVVRADDSRLSNSRTPTAHAHTFDDIAGGSLAGPLIFEEQAAPATPATGLATIYVKADGIPYFKGDDGLERSMLRVNPARHSNPDFETWKANDGRSPTGATTAFPDDWHAFWSSTSIEFYQDTTDKVSGNYSLKIVRPTGTNATVETEPVSIFDVQPGDIVTIGFWAKATGGTGQVNAVLLSSPSGNPDFFGGTTTQTNTFVTLSTVWSYYETSHTIPAGNTRARISLGLNSASGSTVTFWLDNTSSAVRTPEAAVAMPFSARSLTSTQSLTDSTLTTIDWTSNVETAGITYSAGTWTCVTPGLYSITAVLGWTPNATGRRILRVVKNGTEYRRVENAPGNATGSAYTQTIAVKVRLAVSDTVFVGGFQSSGGALTVLSGINSGVEVVRIGA